jgi:Uma2 family endonuclease
MSTAAVAAAAPAPALPRKPRRFSVDEYYRMGEIGLLAAGPRVELIEGEVVETMPPNPPHDGTVAILTRLLFALVPAGWSIRIQLSLRLSTSSPLPDACLAAGDDATYLTRHPGPADVGLIVEVADSSLMDDRRDKGRLYARDGIPECWIVNVPERQLEVHTQPSGPVAAPAYGDVRVYGPGESVPLDLGGVNLGSIAVDDLFP